MVRLARTEDVEQVIAMGQQFVRELPYGDTDVDATSDRIRARFEQAQNMGAVLVGEDKAGLTGMLAFVVAEHPLVGTRMAFEVALWVEPRARNGSTFYRLVHEAFAMAKAMDCRRIQFGAPNDKVARLYGKLGMRAVEATFIKEL